MCTRRLETIRSFECVIVLVIFAAMGESTAPTSILYTCGAKGVVLKPNAVALDHIAIATSSGGSIAYCKPNDFDLKPCKTSQNNNSVTMFYEDKTITNNLMSGKETFKFYKLTCTDSGSTSTKTAEVFFAKGKETIITPQVVNVKHDFQLLLTKENKTPVDRSTDIMIGTRLVLLMTGTNVVITPLNCTAYPEGGDSTKKVTIWSNSSDDGVQHCINTESDVMETDKWYKTVLNKPEIAMKLFAFRFEKRPEVVIECSATVCPMTTPDKCTQECVIAPTAAPKTGDHRKRRGIESGGKDDSERVRSSSVSFAVRENEAQNNSSPGMSVGYIRFVAYGLVLLHVFLGGPW